MADRDCRPERGVVSAFVRGEALRGGLALLLLLVAFFWTPLARYDEVYYSSADLLQDFSLTRVEPGYPAANRIMSDEITEMQPWAMFNRDELREGRIPWWNPWNGAGCPHFANYQSAVFSVFTLPWYVLSTKAALIATAFLKLWACGFFTFLFLQKRRVSFWPALFGASAFMFGGHNVLLVSFPHAGAQAVLPAGLYFAECVLQRFERRKAPLAGLAVTFTLGLLAGQPEVFYFSFAVIATYVAARLLLLLRRTRHEEGAVKRLLALAGKFCFAGVVGAGLAAFQLLPFFEFLHHSRLYEQRSLVQTPLSTQYWPLLFFPDLLGNPSTPWVLSYTLPWPNYELIHMAYAGALVVFVALVALVFARRDKTLAFFALAGTAWLFYAYDLFGAAKFFALIPSVDIAPMNRSQGVWLFCLAVCASIGAEHLLRGLDKRRWLFAGGVLGAALVFLATFTIGADRVLEAHSTFESSNHKLFSLYVPQHVQHMSALFAVGVLALLVLVLARWRPARVLGLLGVATCAFLATGLHLRDYNPVTPDHLFLPATPAMRELTARVGSERLAILGEDKLQPDTNLPYRLQTIDNYDGMWVQKYDHLYRDQFGDTGNWRPMLKASSRALKLFGVQWVLAKWGWNFVDSGFNPLNREAGQKFLIHEIVPGGTVTQTIKAHKNGLQAVAVFLSVRPKSPGAHIDWKLEEVGSEKLVAEQRTTLAEILSTLDSNHHLRMPSDYDVALPGRNVVFRFPRIADSKGKQYKLTLSSEDGRPGNCAHAWSAPLLAYGEGQATWKDKPLKGEILFDFAYDLDRFREEARIGDFVLYRYAEALPFAHLVRGAVIAEDDEEALELLRVPSFDPADIVVLSDDATLPADVRRELGPVDNSQRRLVKFEGDDKVYVVETDARRLVHIQNEVVFLINKFRWEKIETVKATEFEGWPRTFEDMQAQTEAGLRVVLPEVKGQEPLHTLVDEPTRKVFEVNRLWPTYVVIAQAWYPGWKAYVNGAQVPVWRANYAFDAIAAPAGRSKIEFVYAPDSLRAGAWIGVVSAMAGLGALLRRRRVRAA
ncbi:MAG: YfhO family protein [Planctomycetes bacterium]|nr:YfhO family protein [Planctomycetota bacterium]